MSSRHKRLVILRPVHTHSADPAESESLAAA